MPLALGVLQHAPTQSDDVMCPIPVLGVRLSSVPINRTGDRTSSMNCALVDALESDVVDEKALGRTHVSHGRGIEREYHR